MKVPKTITKLINNKYVFYVVSILAIIHLLGYLTMRNFNAFIFFIIVGLLISQFNQNKVIILLGAIFITNFFVSAQYIKEGLENKSDAKSSDNENKNKKISETDKDNQKKEDKSKSNVIVPEYKEDANANTNTNANTNATATENSESGEHNILMHSSSHQSTIHNEGEKTDEEFTSMGINKKRNRIDYASTIEDAYDDLNRILGSDGIKKLTGDTQRLMNQQLQLADAMKSMSPLLEQAKGLLQGFDMKSFDGLASFAKNFESSK
jgi:phosphoglycerol transferase MdoB-like AlkP superfamily enzyme